MSTAALRPTPAQARILAAVAAEEVTLVASPRGGSYWALRGVRVSASTERMIDRLVDADAVTTAPRVGRIAAAILI